MKKLLLFGFLLFSASNFAAIIYVKPVATGNGSGSSWAHASNMHNAIQACTAADEIWAMAGTYISTAGFGRDKGFYIYGGTKKIYGGFNGSETLRSERNFKTNVSILNGDNSGDDNTNLVPTETTRQDNSYHVISIWHQTAGTSNITIDGFTISGGNANGANLTSGAGQYMNSRGGAIYVQSKFANDNMTVKISNCILEKNTGTDVSVVSGYNNSGQMDKAVRTDFTSCIFRNNYATTNGSILIAGASGYRWYGRGTFVNCLFYNNTSLNGAACLYTSASTANGGDYQGTDVDVINCTFSGNSGNTNYAIRTTEGSGVAFINNIIYGNGSTTPIHITGTVWPAFNTNFIEGTQSNPMLDSNYKLQSGSPAINAGANSFIPAGITTDLDGNSRIVNTTVDVGAFEFDASLSTNDYAFSDFSVYPNPTNDNINISSSENIKSIEVYSLEGRKIKSVVTSSVDISDLSSGMYLIQVKTNEEKIGTKKIIKN
jgi:trimeric autotransporter adhesin